MNFNTAKVFIFVLFVSFFSSCALHIIDNGNPVLGANHATSTMTDSKGEVYVNKCNVILGLFKYCSVKKLDSALINKGF